MTTETQYNSESNLEKVLKSGQFASPVSWGRPEGPMSTR